MLWMRLLLHNSFTNPPNLLRLLHTSPLCNLCDTQPPPPATQLAPSTHNYFTLLEQPTAYSIDLRALRDSYRRLQRRWHPDNFSGAICDQQQQHRAAETYSSQLNVGYATLRHPLRRAQHLLALHGLFVHGEAAESGRQNWSPNGASGATPSSTDVLHHVMQMYEQLEEVEEAAATPHVLDSMVADIEDRLERLYASLHVLFEQKQLQMALQAVADIKCYESLRAHITRRQVACDDGDD